MLTYLGALGCTNDLHRDCEEHPDKSMATSYTYLWVKLSQNKWILAEQSYSHRNKVQKQLYMAKWNPDEPRTVPEMITIRIAVS